MRKYFTLLTLLILTVQFSYGQAKEVSLDVHTDNKAYYKVDELEAKDSLQQRQIELLNQDVVDWKAKCDRSEATNDSIQFEMSLKDAAVKNVVANCQRDLNRKSFWTSFYKYTALISVPVAVVTTGLLIVK